MFGETIDMFESLQVTLLGMLVVFLVLMLLMTIIMIMEKIMYGAASRAKPPVSKIEAGKAPEPEKAGEAEDQGDELELVAVIAAAVAAGMGVQPDKLVIRNIVRQPETAPAWNITGRMDQMAKRLNG
ncbi:MAG: hypothetical protein HPY66_2498 [Firmicutes bacterium]|nr:hypothetical protein [Bacillota bacterium]MDI6707089.1 OadG family transporter subunit [Bacillota bacterium]